MNHDPFGQIGCDRYLEPPDTDFLAGLPADMKRFLDFEGLMGTSASKMGLKVLGVIILIIALIVGIGFGVIYYLTKPVDDTSDKAINVGGMLTSQNIDYKEASADGLENDLIVKIMQVSWKFCDKSDKKRMASDSPENAVRRFFSVCVPA